MQGSGQEHTPVRSARMRVAAIVSHWRSVSFPEAGPPLSQVVMVAHESLYPTDWVGPRPKVILLIWTLLASSSGQDTLPRAGHPHRGSAGSWLVLAFTSWGPKPLPPLPPKLLSFLSLGAERTDYPNPQTQCSGPTFLQTPTLGSRHLQTTLASLALKLGEKSFYLQGHIWQISCCSRNSF